MNEIQETEMEKNKWFGTTKSTRESMASGQKKKKIKKNATT